VLLLVKEHHCVKADQNDCSGESLSPTFSGMTWHAATGVDKGAQGAKPPNGRAKKNFFVKIEGLSS